MEQRSEYKFISLSSVLKEEFHKETGKRPEESKRTKLQDYGDSKRGANGNGYFAEKALQEIEKDTEQKWVVDGIKNPGEIHKIREFSSNFFLFGIYAEEDTRWKRVKDDPYNNHYDEFLRDDQRDRGMDSPPYGQRVTDCFYEADIFIINDDHIEAPGNEQFNEFKGKIDQYREYVEKPLEEYEPRPDESLMAMAYAVSQRSSCLRRKVGAVIADPKGNIISSGYNEIPGYQNRKDSCMGQYTTCYRKKIKEDFELKLQSQQAISSGKEELFKKEFKKFKMLDYCRAIHGEENAILNLVRNMSSFSLKHSVIYVTTHPCRLCSNKIVHVDIKKVIYVEPYPDKESKIILEKAGVDCEVFEGVTYKGYFRIFGETR